jgi:hypothetical protein
LNQQEDLQTMKNTNTPEEQEREFYAFTDANTGKLVRARGVNRSDFSLSNYDTDPVFEAPSSDALAMALFENTPGYNSSNEYPNWGPFSREQLVPVKVVVKTTIEPVPLPAPLRVKTLEVRNMMYMVARRYAGGDLPEVMPDGYVAFWLVELPLGITLEDAQAWEGKAIFADNDKYLQRKLYKAVAVPEDYQPEVAGKNAALFLASTL